MDRTRVVLVLLFGLVFSDYTEPARSLDNNNPSFWDQSEIVTQPPLQDLSALDNCGQGDQQGKFLCVPYYNCDPKTNEISSTDVYVNRTFVISRRDDMCVHYLDKCCKIPAGGLPNPTGNQNNDEDGYRLDTPTSINSTANNFAHMTSRPNQPSNTRRPVTNPGTFLCGIRNKNGIDFQITGNSDNEAEYGEFPWVVALLEKNDDPKMQVSFCVGSLLGANVVLTSGHCVMDRRADAIKVRAGEWDSQTTKERIPFQERDVRRIIMHEDFHKGALFNDVAILILNRGLTKVESVAPICLPDQDQHLDSVRCIATGWGKDRFGVAGRYVSILKKIEMPLVHHDDCERALRTTRLGPRFILDKTFRCAGGEGGSDTCTGDGGSPLVCQHPDNPNRYIQVGIVSWGIGCGNRGIPGAYADVTQFRRWIDEKLQQASIGSESYTIDV